MAESPANGRSFAFWLRRPNTRYRREMSLPDSVGGQPSSARACSRLPSGHRNIGSSAHPLPTGRSRAGAPVQDRCDRSMTVQVCGARSHRRAGGVKSLAEPCCARGIPAQHRELGRWAGLLLVADQGLWCRAASMAVGVLCHRQALGRPVDWEKRASRVVSPARSRAEERGRDNPKRSGGGSPYAGEGDDRATRCEPAGSLLRECASRRMNGAAGLLH
jgi:hypothetical protein